MRQWQIKYIIRFYVTLLEVPLFLWTESIFFFYLYLYTLVTGLKGQTPIYDSLAPLFYGQSPSFFTCLCEKRWTESIFFYLFI